MSIGTCRFCNSPLTHTFLDLGMSPLANSFVDVTHLEQMEPYYPLHTYVCSRCLLVQLGQIESPAHLFSHYLYLSSYSTSWLKHAEQFTKMAIDRFQLHAQSQVIEVASNDGYLLQYFKQASIPALGIEPAHNIAEIARDKGIPTHSAFFGEALAELLVQEELRADLIVANNVLAHVPNLHDFIAGLRLLLKPDGVITLEFPHLLQLMNEKQFDTIYHEHFSYFSLYTLRQILNYHQLQVIDVEEWSTHGGSLRVYVRHQDCMLELPHERVIKLLDKEREFGLDQLDRYLRFSAQITQIKVATLQFFIQAQEQDKRIVGYGAPAKGNTFLNYCGIGKSHLLFTVDQNPHKQGLYLPGSHVPIVTMEEIQRAKPDYVLLLPWNLKQEISEACSFIREWGGKFIICIPQLEVL